MAEPLGNACISCGLHLTHAGPQIIQAVEDGRGYGLYEKRVLVILASPSTTDAHTGRLLNDDGTSWVLDYLNNSSFEWMLTSVLLCSVPTDYSGRTIPQKPPVYRHCSSNYLMPTIAAFQPHAILALGTEPLAAVWPSTRGACPSITKARMAPVRLEELAGQPWLITSYSPRQHGWWIDSGGSKGQDLTEEYIRTFELLHKTLDSGFEVHHPDWKLVQTVEDLQNFCAHLHSHNVTELILDTENATWMGRNIRTWKADPEGVLPDRLTPWHEGNELVCVGITIQVKGRYETYVISTDPLESNKADLWLSWFKQIVHGRRISAWNNISDFQDLFIFLGLDVLCGDDGFLLRGLRDSSQYDNSLKITSGELLTVPDWSDELNTQLDLAKKGRTSQGLPALSCMADIPVEVVYDYNAHDTFNTAKLLKEHFTVEKLGPDFPWVAYNELLDGLPWLMEMERNGLPVDEKQFNLTLDELEAEEIKLLAELRAYPEVQRAEFRSGKPFNIRSSLFYKELIRELYGIPDGLGGFELPEEFPRTAGGQLSADKVQFAKMAGNELKAMVPLELKSPAQQFWHKVATWKEVGDDFTKLLGLLDFVVDGTIHARCRILRTDTAADSDEGGGGTTSGRFCVAKGTPVEMPRNLSLHPKGIPIEDVIAGDLVYSYDAEGTLSLRRVLWAGQTGIKTCLSIHWSGQGQKGAVGILQVTPEHLVRMIDGSWKPAAELQVGDRVMALSRGIGPYGYARLYACRSREIPNEHRFIAKQITQSDMVGKHTHHKDENKINNCLGNLEVLTPLEHVAKHPQSPFKSLTACRGADHHMFIPISKWKLLRMLAECGGGPKKAADTFGYDYSTIIAKCEQHGVDWQAVRRRYNSEGTYLSAGTVRRALEGTYENANEIQKVLKVSFYKVKELAEFYGLQPRNHRITAVLPGPTVPVYDLEVEDTHCFIASEIAIHNSFSPNIGNLKKTRRYLRNFAAPPGWVWCRFDYGRIELAWLAWNTQDPLMLDWALAGKDQHRERGAVIWGTTFNRDSEDFFDLDSATQETWREKGKTQNFADVYLEEPETTARKLGVDVEDVLAALQQSALTHPKVLDLKKAIYETCQRGGFVTSTLLGRRRSAKGWNPSRQSADEFFSLEDTHRRARDQRNCDIFRSIWNSRAAQTDASDTTFCAGKRIHRMLQGRKWLDPDRVKSINFIHDSLDYLVREEYVDEACPQIKFEVVESTQHLPAAFPIRLTVDEQRGFSLAAFLKK